MEKELINNQKYEESIYDYQNFLQKEYCLEELPTVVIMTQPQTEEPLKQKTGMYDPETKTIWIFCHGRIIKDILRSFGHEMYHYKQHINGELTDNILNMIATNYNIEDPAIQNIEGPAFQNGSFALRKYTQSLNENIIDVFSKYATQKDTKRKEEQKNNMRKIIVQKKNMTSTTPAPQKPNKFDKLEELRPELSEISYISGPQKKQRGHQDTIQEFDSLFQKTFSEILGPHGFELENYSEPGLFYEYTLNREQSFIVITILPNGVKNNDFEQIQDSVLSITIQEKNNKDTFDFTFKKIKQLYIKLNKILKSIVSSNSPS